MVLLGHKEAWEKAKILHRDVSIGNIMLVVDQNVSNESGESYGILID